jgi:hypothetical protein
MATPAQIAANRANAQHSTGPRTDEGKAKARQNALRHGLCSAVPLMSGELDEEVQQLLTALREEYQPVGDTEEILVYKMAEHFFCGKRAAYLLSEQLDSNDHGDDNAREIGLMMRYHAASDRGYYRALTELRKVQKERRLQEIGSVSSAPHAATFSDLSFHRVQPDPTTDPSNEPLKAAPAEPGQSLEIGSVPQNGASQPGLVPQFLPETPVSVTPALKTAPAGGQKAA